MSTTETSSGNSYQVVGDMSASFRSGAIWLGPGTKTISFEASWTGTPTGAFTLETANNSSDTVGAPMTQTAAMGGSPDANPFVASQPAGSAGGVFLDNIKTAALLLFVVYTKTSGTGTATAIVGRTGA